MVKPKIQKKIEEPDKFRQKIIRTFTLILIILLSSWIIPEVYRYFSVHDDNIVEEFIENKLESFIGVDIDLTPGTKEYFKV